MELKNQMRSIQKTSDRRVLGLKTPFATFMLCFLVALAAQADSLPAAEDINKLAQAVKTVASDYRTAANQLRFQYEYTGRFLNTDDKDKLSRLAKQASDQLRKTAQDQDKLKARIEEYEGDDWEDRYGATGLWRKLFKDLYVTNVERLEIDFQAVICAEEETRSEILHDILTRIEALRLDYDAAYLQLLNAKALALLAPVNHIYESSARKEFTLLAERSDMRHSTVFKIAIERIKLFGPAEPERLSELTGEIARSNDVNDIQLVLSLACLQHRLNLPEAFEKTVRTWPRIRSFLGRLALIDLDHSLEQGTLDLEEVPVFEAELATQTAWTDLPQNWYALLSRLSDSAKFRTPLILYVTAAASAKSSPIEAGQLLIRAATIQKQAQSETLDIEPERIAEQAATLLCNMRPTEQAHYRAIIDVFEAYRRIAEGRIDGELEYCYAAALIAAGQKQKGTQLLAKIAQTPTASRRFTAKLDLIKDMIARYQARRLAKADVAKELLDLLVDPDAPRLVAAQALQMYCRLLLDAPTKAEAQNVLAVLGESEIQNDPNLNVFKAAALRRLGRLEESAKYMARACRTNNHEHVIEAAKLLAHILEQIEQLQHDSSDSAELLANSRAIARYCERISLSTYGLMPPGRARLYLAEISLLEPSADPRKISQVEKLLEDISDEGKQNVDFLRCRARLLAAKAEFAAAAHAWAKVAEIQKNRSPSPNKRNANWWRARFYELHCWSKTPQTKTKDLVHAIDVLRSSFADVPALWAEKLDSLKQQAGKGDDNSPAL